MRSLVLPILIAALLAPAAAHARRDRQDFAEGVVFAEADQSPVPAVSNINEYTFQEERINIDPRDGIIKVLRTDQKILINEYVTAIIPVHHANPRELRTPIRTMVRKEGGEADVVQDKEGGQFYLHVVCPRFQLPFVQQVVEGLDREWVQERIDGSGELYYPAKFRNIRNIQRISRFYIGPEGVGRFLFDDLNNAMYYTDQPALIGLQSWGLSQIDIPPNQVRLEITLYEIDKVNDTLIGLDWAAWRRGPGRSFFELGYYHETTRMDTTNTATRRLEGVDIDRRFNFASISAVGASQFLDFVQNKGYVRELVRTTVTVKSGDPALVEAVDAVAHFRSESLGDQRRDETLVDRDGVGVDVTLPDERGRTVSYLQASDRAGVRLVVVPYVALESMELDIQVDVSSVSGYTPAGNPIMAVHRVAEYVRLVDGQPFVMGGIDRETTVRQKNGFPFLHSLPVVGWLFGNEVNAKRETRLMVVVKPEFLLGGESVRAMPVEALTIMAQARGDEPLEVPATAFGFDQWLLDGRR